MIEDEKEKALDLLAEQAVFGLSEEELAELAELEKQFPEFSDDDSFERAAAAVNLTDAAAGEPMPAHLRAKILADAEDFFASQSAKAKVLSFESPVKAESRTANAPGAREPLPGSSGWQRLGWAVAAAACIVLAVNVWLTRIQPPEIVRTPPAQTPAPELSPAQKRQQLLASAANLIRTDWTGADPKQASGISGDVVWSDAEQKGYMRFRGLPPNDPNRSTYQLWIFDENQDEKTPVDGGVFDVREAGEIIVPIDPKLGVKNPKMFAVTVEKPGGVVVSKREKVVAIAKVAT